ncbi:MAG: hypothetical protein QOI98_3218, partial [Solirubrobacteraceae bacterium]|nr:hypothetical protein [Solirubrobacteraceae bacterium]
LERAAVAGQGEAVSQGMPVRTSAPSIARSRYALFVAASSAAASDQGAGPVGAATI